MLLQGVLTQRIIIVLILQVWPIFYGSYFTYRLLKRARNRSTYTLGTIFIMTSLTYSLVGLSLVFVNTPVAYFFYIFGIFFFFFNHCFFIIFSWVLVKLDEKAPYWKFHLIIVLYGFISSFILFIGYYANGLVYDSSTNWIPTFSWFFLIIGWTFLLVFLVIPQIYYIVKLLKIFEGVTLKRRINLFIISIVLEFTMLFAWFLYNTWIDNIIYRTIYLFTFPLLGTIAALLLFKSFGKELD